MLVQTMGGSPPQHVLLYGSLCRSEPAHRTIGLHEALSFVGERWLTGALYDLGEYPGLVRGAGAVRAELFRIRDPDVLSTLDAFEGYDGLRPAASLYRRIVEQVPRDSSRPSRLLRRPIDAWLYLYNGSIDGKPLVTSPSWAEHLATRAAIAARGDASHGPRTARSA